jgi:rhamnosyltransferase
MGATFGDSSRPLSVGIAIMTYNAAELLPKSLPPLLALSPRPMILIIDSSSRDGTVEIAHAMGVETLVIPQCEFNHGATRELARRALGTDIAVMMTHDAIAVGSDMISNLVAPILRGEAAVSYARQLPHDNADFFESFPREFNYPAISELRSAEDITMLGPRTFFCSDSCCAWSNIALDAVGGFKPTLTAEDVIAAAKLIHAGYKIAYRADALVKHSHRYTLGQEFRRYFDTGYFRAQNRRLLFTSGGDEKVGAAFTHAMLRRLWRESPGKIPYALLVNVIKLLGYRAGYHGLSLPTWFKRRMSGQPYFWRKEEVSRFRPDKTS